MYWSGGASAMARQRNITLVCTRTDGTTTADRIFLHMRLIMLLFSSRNGKVSFVLILALPHHAGRISNISCALAAN